MWKNLEEGNTVIPVYLYLNNLEQKSKLEAANIHKLITLFRSRYPGQVESLVTTTLDIGITTRNYAPTRRARHMPIWILTLLYAQDTTYHDEIQMGIIENDDIIPLGSTETPTYLEHMINIYNSFAPVCKPLVPLTFPLVNKAKVDIIAELPDEYFNLTVSCERPIEGNPVKYCGHCSPCKRLLTLGVDKLNQRFVSI